LFFKNSKLTKKVKKVETKVPGPASGHSQIPSDPDYARIKQFGLDCWVTVDVAAWRG